MKIVNYLKKYSIPQETFAVSIEVSQGMVSHIINGKTNITLELAMKIERATGGEVTVYDCAYNKKNNLKKNKKIGLYEPIVIPSRGGSP